MQVVLQPTTLCNLSCTYCYLPEKEMNKKMGVEVAEKIALDLSTGISPVDLIWHAGEPLATGIEHFRNLLKCFEKVKKHRTLNHALQTNGTLINDEWCQLFREFNVEVGVSIDGPAEMNSKRVNWIGKPSYDKITQGIDILRRHGIRFMCICVVCDDGLHQADKLYRFFQSLGCYRVAFNIEETVGVHTKNVSNDSGVQNFWSDIFRLWKQSPEIEIREMAQVFSYLTAVSTNDNVPQKYSVNVQNLFPCIAFNGDVVLLSPEFLNSGIGKYNNFVVGNVMKQDLDLILSSGLEADYVRDYKDGIEMCYQSCEYADFCGGGTASSKFYELGTTNATETAYCRNVKKHLP